MLIRQLLENKKGIKAVKYNKKPKAHTPAEERKVIGPNVPKKKEKVTERVGQNADGSLILPDPNINRLAGKPNPPAAEPAPSNVKSGGATVEYSGKTYDVMVFGDKSIRPRISGSDTVVSAKVYTKGNKMFVLLDTPAQESVTEDRNGNDVEEFLHKVARSGDNGYNMLYNAQKGKYGREIEQAIQDMYDDISIDTGYHGDDDFEQIYDRMLDNIEADYGQQGVAEGWQEDSQELEDWSKEVNKRLYRAHESQRPALARQLSKLEQKNFGSSLNQGSLTELVHSALMAIRKGQMVHYDPQSVGQMPFGNIVGDDARIIAASGMSQSDNAGFRALKRAGILDTIQQFLQLRDFANSKGEDMLKYSGMDPVAGWMQFVKDTGWSKDDMNEEVDEGGRNYDDNRTGFGRPERDMSDESNLLYIYKDGRVKQRMVSNTVEREARAQGFRDTPEQALKMHGIVKSKFKPGKWIQKQGDQWVDVYPFGKPNDIAETATPGATSAGNVATLGMNPKLSPGPARGKKSYIGTPGKSGTKAPPQPKVNQPKTKHGTAVNALDMKSNIFGGGKAIKRK